MLQVTNMQIVTKRRKRIKLEKSRSTIGKHKSKNI